MYAKFTFQLGSGLYGVICSDPILDLGPGTLSGQRLINIDPVFFRNLIGFIAVIPLISSKGLGILRTSNFPMHLLRAFAAFAGGLSVFYAVGHAPLATVVAITFTAPIFASVFAMLVFGETVNKTRLVSLAVSFIGVLILLRPSFDMAISGFIAANCAAVMTALAFLTVKKLSFTERSETVVAYPFLLILPFSAVLAYFDWTTPTLSQLPLLLMMGLGISAAQYCMVKAFALADASAVLPLDFLRLLVATLVGHLFFNDLLDTWVLLGASIIFLSSLYLARKERGANN